MSPFIHHLTGRWLPRGGEGEKEKEKRGEEGTTGTWPTSTFPAPQRWKE